MFERIINLFLCWEKVMLDFSLLQDINLISLVKINLQSCLKEMSGTECDEVLLMSIDTRVMLLSGFLGFDFYL